MIVALAGGVGAARFLDGLARVISPKELFIIGNTGDDAEIHDLHISPDLDTVVYTLAGLADPVRGWGLRGDTFHNLDALGRLGADTWFQLGDRDLVTHIFRTERMLIITLCCRSDPIAKPLMFLRAFSDSGPLLGKEIPRELITYAGRHLGLPILIQAS